MLTVKFLKIIRTHFVPWSLVHGLGPIRIGTFSLNSFELFIAPHCPSLPVVDLCLNFKYLNMEKV